MPSPTSRPHGLYPFWFWNDRLDEQELRHQVREMADKGVRGFFIHSRQGLAQPYLSEAFFTLVDAVLDEARKLDLVVHLYDEYPYPSGIAGGEVVLGKPQFLATRLAQQRFTATGMLRRDLPRGRILQAIAFPRTNGGIAWQQPLDLQPYIGMLIPEESFVVAGLTMYNRKRYFTSNPRPALEIELPPGDWEIFISTQALVEGHKYWFNFVDVLNPQAVAEFIKLTHERYLKRFGNDFGNLIQSIFVDETAPHWSDLLPAEFERTYDYDLCNQLHVLQDPSHPEHQKVSRELRNVRYRMFCHSFEEQISNWCRQHNIKYSGEKPSMRLAELKYMDIPGCEPGHTKAGNPDLDFLRPNPRQNARAAASAAYFYGREGALCECYHSLGWSGTLQDARLLADGLLLMGIRYLVPHGFFYTTHALKKHDAPPTFFFQMPYWPLFQSLSNRLEVLGKTLDNTWIDADILVVDPNWGLPGKTELEAYEALLWKLSAEHLDFLIVDTDILQAGTIKDGKVRCRDVNANIVLLPKAPSHDPVLLDWLQQFEAAGGVAIHDEAQPDQTLEKLRRHTSPNLSFEAIDGDCSRILSVTRSNGKKRIHFLVNTADQSLDLRLNSKRGLREIPLENTTSLLVAKNAGYARKIAPFESLLLEETPSPVENPITKVTTLTIGGACKFQTMTPNLLRLGDWKLSLLDKSGKAMQTETVEALPIANQLKIGKFRFAPVFTRGFGEMPEFKMPELHLRYETEFESRTNAPVELVMEPGSLTGDWMLQINGGAPLAATDFSPTRTHVRGSLGIDISNHTRRGSNHISISLTTDKLDGGLRNPLYLAGDFSVQLQPLRLEEKQTRGQFEAYEDNGLPFFSGCLEYHFTLEVEEMAECVELAFEHPVEEAMRISLNEGAWHDLPWSPRRFTCAPGELRLGSNKVKLQILTSLIRAFEGQRFDITEHNYRNIGENIENP